VKLIQLLVYFGLRCEVSFVLPGKDFVAIVKSVVVVFLAVVVGKEKDIWG
jgi:hypothetical protein